MVSHCGGLQCTGGGGGGSEDHEGRNHAGGEDQVSAGSCQHCPVQASLCHLHERTGTGVIGECMYRPVKFKLSVMRQISIKYSISALQQLAELRFKCTYSCCTYRCTFSHYATDYDCLGTHERWRFEGVSADSHEEKVRT